MTYASNVDAHEISSDDVQVIPAAISVPSYNPVDTVENFTPVFFDLETTSLSRDCETIQIAAAYSDQTFNRYVLPTGSIP